MKRYFKDYLYLFSLAGLIIVLDQWTKGIVRSQLALGEIWSPWDWLAPYARIVHWNNTGAALGIFKNGGTVFAILASIVSLGIIYYFPQISVEDWLIRLAVSFQLGGAAGNLVDRVARGPVTDFISVGTFPVVNIADSSISVGVALLLISLWFKQRKIKSNIRSFQPLMKNGD